MSTDQFDRYSRCPCGNDKKAKFCCNRIQGRWQKDPAVIVPIPPSTNLVRNGCYLSFTHDCGGPISMEHFIPKAMQLDLTTDGMSAINGLSWPKLDGEQFTRVPVSLVASKVLCKRHNEALSSLDAAATKLKRVIGCFDQDFQGPAPRADLAVFAGEDIERWLLKVLVGFIASEQSKHAASQQLEKLARVLIGTEFWHEHWGLYIIPKEFQHERHIRLETLVDTSSSRIVAVRFYFNGISFVFALAEQTGVMGAIFRPHYLRFKHGEITKTIILTWMGQTNEPNIEFTFANKTTAESPDFPSYPVRELR